MPHSEIPGSKPVRGSPRLIAAYHVLHRLSAPRHPPDTLLALDSCSKSENGRQKTEPEESIFRIPQSAFRLPIEKTSFASNTSGNPRSGRVHDWYALDSRSDDGFEVSLKPGVLSGRDRMRFLFTMSDGVETAAPRSKTGHPSVLRAACRSLSSKIARRAEP